MAEGFLYRGDSEQVFAIIQWIVGAFSFTIPLLLQMTFYTSPRSCFSRFREQLFNSYCQVVVGHPLLLILSTFLTCILLSAIGIYYHYDIVDFNPSKGFETRGTPLSQGKMLLDQLKDLTAAPIDIYKSRMKLGKREAIQLSTMDPTVDILNQVSDNEVNETEEYSGTTYEPIIVNYDEYGVDSEPNVNDLNDPCTQYGAIGKKIPFDVFDILAKVVLETENLFTLKTFQALCKVDELIELALKNTGISNVIIPQLKHSFNLPYVSTCLNLNSLKECNYLKQKDIDYLRKTLDDCKYGDSDKDICQLPMIQQASNLLLPLDRNTSLVTVLLPLRKGYDTKSITFFEQLEKVLADHFSRNGITLKGIDFGTKTRQFQGALFKDALLSAVSATLVLITFYLYSRSIFFTLIILALIIFSMTLAFFAYAVLLGIDFFPFLNLLVTVLMASVGADDAFLLLSYYKQERKHYAAPWKPGDIYLPAGPLHIRCLQNSLRHSLMSMFITSATTAVAFLSNLSSDIVVLRCFGIYACLTVMFNYILVVFILPATIMLTQDDREPISMNIRLEMLTDFGVKIIASIRWIIVSIGVIATVFAVYATFINPGLHLPEYNPTKLLVDSIPSEWFDNNAHLFNFEWKRSYYIQKYFLIDKMKVRDSNMLSAQNNGKIKQRHMSFTGKEVAKIERSISIVLGMSDEPAENSYISGFANSSCSQEAQVTDQCFIDHCFKRLPMPFPDDFSKYPADGPLFDKNLSLIGYYLSVPSKTKLTAELKKVSEAFTEINSDCSTMKRLLGKLPLRCFSSGEITKYYDIIERLRPSTLSSVGISLVVSLIVVVLCTQQVTLSFITVLVICTVVLWTTSTLVLLGWQLSVVESTIIVLTIGLSFDFSLHIAASIKDAPDLYMIDRIRSAYNSAGTACTLAACSSVVCGIPLLFASTAAFYQVGVMLISLGFISLTGALIMLPSCLLCLYTERKTLISKF